MALREDMPLKYAVLEVVQQMARAGESDRYPLEIATHVYAREPWRFPKSVQAHYRHALPSLVDLQKVGWVKEEPHADGRRCFTITVRPRGPWGEAARRRRVVLCGRGVRSCAPLALSRALTDRRAPASPRAGHRCGHAGQLVCAAPRREQPGGAARAMRCRDLPSRAPRVGFVRAPRAAPLPAPPPVT
jgi:hypothetical protein